MTPVARFSRPMDQGKRMRPAQVRGPSRFGRVMWSTTSLFHCDSRPRMSPLPWRSSPSGSTPRSSPSWSSGTASGLSGPTGRWRRAASGPGGRPGEVSGIERNGGPDARPFGCPRLGGRRGAVAVGRDCGRPAGRTPAERRQEARSGPSGGTTPAEWGQDAVASGGGVVAEANLLRTPFMRDHERLTRFAESMA